MRESGSLWCIFSLSLSFHPTICGTVDVLPPPPVFCPKVVVSLRVMSGSALYCTWYREIRGWQPYRSRWHHMPGSVSSGKVGYCKLVFTSLGNIYLKYQWVLYHLEKQAGCYKGSRGQGVAKARRYGNPVSGGVSLFREEDGMPKERSHKERGISLHPAARKCVPISSKGVQEQRGLAFWEEFRHGPVAKAQFLSRMLRGGNMQ